MKVGKMTLGHNVHERITKVRKKWDTTFNKKVKTDVFCVFNDFAVLSQYHDLVINSHAVSCAVKVEGGRLRARKRSLGAAMVCVGCVPITKCSDIGAVFL